MSLGNSKLLLLLAAGALILSTADARLRVPHAAQRGDGSNAADGAAAAAAAIEYIDIDKIPIPVNDETDWEVIDAFYGAMQHPPPAEDGDAVYDDGDVVGDDDERRELKNDKNKNTNNKKAKKNASSAQASTAAAASSSAQSAAQAASASASSSSSAQWSQVSYSSVSGSSPGCAYPGGVDPLGCDRGGASNQVIRVKNVAFGSCYTVDKCLFAAMPKQMAYWCPLQARPCCGGLCYQQSSCGDGVRDENGGVHTMASFGGMGMGWWYANLGYPECSGY